MRMIESIWTGLLGLLVLATGSTAAAADSTAAGKLVLVVGAAGTEEFGEQFNKDAARWLELGKQRKMEVVYLANKETSGTGTVTPDGAATQRDQLKSALEKAVTEKTNQLWIVLIGHGTSDRGVHKFNLVGPDASAKEIAEWCKPLECPLVLINCSSASAPFLPELSGPGRIVITATRSGSENNYSRFGDQLAESILDPSTDIDHDDEVSLLEAFLSAATKTEKIYKEMSRLATEHALLDDNGDKLGTGAEFFRGTRTIKTAQGGKQPDGAVASQIRLFVSPNGPQFDETQLSKRAEIERQIEQLRSRKPSPPTDAYWSELETLMLQLARLYNP